MKNFWTFGGEFWLFSTSRKKYSVVYLLCLGCQHAPFFPFFPHSEVYFWVRE